MAPDGCCSYKHTLLLFSSSMTPTDFHLLPPRELIPQPYSQDMFNMLSVETSNNPGRSFVRRLKLYMTPKVCA